MKRVIVQSGANGCIFISQRVHPLQGIEIRAYLLKDSLPILLLY